MTIISDTSAHYKILLSCRPKIYVEVAPVIVDVPMKGKEAIFKHREFRHSLSGMRIMWTFERHGNGLHWIHVSCSHRDRYPTWEELKAAKESLIGDVWVYQVLPPKEHYMNIMVNCFHLWHCLDRDLFEEMF